MNRVTARRGVEGTSGLPAIVCLAMVWSCLPGVLNGAEGVQFSRDILPILAGKCFACHGPDEAHREADLRLDVPPSDDVSASLFSVSRPEAGELIRRVASHDADLVMPPPDKGERLTDAEVDVLKRWIASGARYQTHWAFLTPRRRESPQLEDEGWCRQPWDWWVLEEMRRHNLSPADDEDPHVLVRRLYLDVIGLPPAPEAADAFAADPTNVNYEKMVDALLDSERFGEHWARMWLDLARYADTKGYEKDQPREIWRYRDWVIDALNQDMPFDRFTRDQLAGDLLPNATMEQVLATAFHRNTMTNDEGGTDNEEFRVAAVKDRVDTTVQVWMGLTMGCAKCHSHKYDPISQREYYRFFALFNQTEDADRPDDAPRLATPTPQQVRQTERLTAQLEQMRATRDNVTPEFVEAQRAWEAEVANQQPWTVLAPKQATATDGTTLTIQDDQSVLASGKRPPQDTYRLEYTAAAEQPITAIRVEVLTHPTLPKNGPGRNPRDPNFVLSELQMHVVRDGSARAVALEQAKADFSQHNWPVARAIDGDAATGWAVSPRKGEPHVAIFSLAEPLQLGVGDQLRVTLSQQYAAESLLIGRVRCSVSTEPFAKLTPESHELVRLALLPPARRTPQQEQQLRAAYRQTLPKSAAIDKQIQELEQQRASLKQQIANTPVMRELPTNRRRKTHIHIRGNFLDPGDEVQPGFPAALGSIPAIGTADRLAVANWLMSEDNPLTARVMANRVWARLFGRGLVETEEDFGLQGTPPTHPELLDQLAVEFRDSYQWSIKRLVKSIVLSSTYRQAATVTDEHRRLDPSNRWLSRGTRFRLPAEAVRDQALAAAGLLSGKIGGPSVMPPQPEGIWRATYSTLKWKTSAGEDRYRRGLYTFLRRTSPYPSLVTFDAGSREVCQMRRIRTNTPLQALVVMNDPVYLEAAGALAAAVDRGTVREALATMFRRVLVRPPSDSELDRLATLYQQTRQELGRTPESIAELCRAANLPDNDRDRLNLASRTVVASAILNLDEAFTRP